MVDLMNVKQLVTLIVGDLAHTLLTHVFTAREINTLLRHSEEAKDPRAPLLDRLCTEAVDRILRVVYAQRGRSQGCDVTVSHPGGGGGGEHAFVLVHRSAAGEPQSAEVTVQETTPTCAPPDHEYARPPSSPCAAAEPVDGTGSTRTPPRRRRTKKEDADAEIHLECSLCGKLFPNAERLSDHRARSHLQCSVCAAPFGGLLKLREHERREHGLLPHACHLCPRTFNHKAHRDLHVKARHAGDRSCRCDVCGKGYPSAGLLRTHRITHFDKSFVCDVCGRRFYHACHLTRHKLVHGDERPFRCATCGRGFAQAANLRSHQAVHSGERHLCAVCGKSYRRLRNHMVSRHWCELSAAGGDDAGVVVVCDVCGKKFPNRSRLRVHRRRHASEKPLASCHVGGKHIRRRAFLKAHLQTKGHLQQVGATDQPLTSDQPVA